MDFSAALPTFIITLREGVEAALVVGIVLALLNKAQKSYLNRWVYIGVGVGIILSALIGVLFTSLISILKNINPEYAPIVEPIMEGVFCTLAIAMLSWMLIWMTKQAKNMKAEVESAVSEALVENSNAGWGVFLLILVAVVREGVETVLFIAANFQEGLIPVTGAIAGICGAVLIGMLLFKWGIKINIRQFFQFMGVFLLLIVSGLVISALRKFDAALGIISASNLISFNFCSFYDSMNSVHSCVLGPLVWDNAGVLPDNKFPGLILKSLFGYRHHLYLIQAVAYSLFLSVVGSLYFRSLNISQAIKINKKLKNKPVQ
ncbi:MAG: FTR1 family protein [Mastigocoleus sp.]